MRAILVVLALPLLYAGAAGAGEKNLVALHADAKRLPMKECLGCHPGITRGATANARIKTFHRLHLESKKGTPTTCAECHPSVDLREGSAGASRKQVDPALCAGCHRGALPAAKVLYVQ